MSDPNNDELADLYPSAVGTEEVVGEIPHEEWSDADKAMYHFEANRVETPPTDYVSPYDPQGAAYNEARHEFSQSDLDRINQMRMDHPEAGFTDEVLATEVTEMHKVYGEDTEVNVGQLGNNPTVLRRALAAAKRLGY